MWARHRFTEGCSIVATGPYLLCEKLVYIAQPGPVLPLLFVVHQGKQVHAHASINTPGLQESWKLLQQPFI